MSNQYNFGIHKNQTPLELFYLIFLDEAAKELGIEDLAALGAIIAGQPMLSTRQKPRGATPGTSPASVLARKYLPYEIKVKILPTLTYGSIKKGKIIFTRNIGVFVGRALPGLGYVLLAKDVYIITRNATYTYNRIVKPEDRVF
ncbi:hypothetical protein HZU77_008230 [Neisseriaceae bacterium TC5R-5]|nr:hypothetical protein [Neisseriaceae bacterium TC5R-5]